MAEHGPGMTDRNGRCGVLSLFAEWCEGAVLAAGQCLLSTESAPKQMLGEECDRCPNLIILGATDAELDEHLADHRRRCHPTSNRAGAVVSRDETPPAGRPGPASTDTAIPTRAVSVDAPKPPADAAVQGAAAPAGLQP